MTSKQSGAVVITSIAAPNSVLKTIASDCRQRGLHFFVIGDTKSPNDFSIEGCDFYSIDRQLALPFKTAALTPTRHYARKNIGYLLAIQAGASVILETDDDNMPGPEFYRPLPVVTQAHSLRNTGWVNIYRYYTSQLIWPRGLPLDAVQDALPPLGDECVAHAPIQQGLADDNPDVDAIFRLVLPLPLRFDAGSKRIALHKDAWCPWNSQNTAFYPEAYPLLYLPAYCSFRMTDIWRSFVAQRICWENGWTVLFREATVEQFRNDHRLMKDFEDEVPGYLHNRQIGDTLQKLTLKPGVEHILDNMRLCYVSLIQMGIVGEQELPLFDAWAADIQHLQRA